MLKIDSHQHFWKFNTEKDSWITEEMSVLRQDFLPGNLSPLLSQSGIEGCVAVQADQSNAENEFLLKLADQHSFIKGVVGWADLQSPSVQDQLSDLKRHSKLKGFRHILQGESERDFMLKPAFINGIKSLKTFDYSYDMLIHADQLHYLPDFISLCPDQRFVLDHIAKPDIKNKDIKAWAADLKQLAQFENLSCKLSGMVTEADLQDWNVKNFEPYIDMVFQVFGAKRLMFGSDWPVCLLAASYSDVISILEPYISQLTSNEQSQFWGENARDFYKLN
ncbi:MAG: amidohydrolase [Pedobacter sp.]|nr:MAG: amidohydrolase [Pedobacter sp.]